MRRLALVLPFVTAACSGASPSLFCAGGGGTCAAVATASGSGSSLGAVSVDGGSNRLGADTLDAHVLLRVFNDELYVLQEDSGSVRIYDPKTLALKTELTFGDATHPAAMTQPRDLWVDEGRSKIWATLSGNAADSALGIVQRDKPGSVVYVGMPQASGDPDGKPEADLIRLCNTKLYVTLKGSYDDGKGGLAYVQGRIGITDADKHTVRGVIPLAGKNPVAFVHIEDDCNQGVVATASTGDVLDNLGTLERFDLNKGASRGVIFTDRQLGGQPHLLATGDGHRMYVALRTASSQFTMDKVVALDWKALTLLGDVTGELDDVSALVKFDGHVYVGSSDGLHVASDDATMAGAPIDVGGAAISVALP